MKVPYSLDGFELRKRQRMIVALVLEGDFSFEKAEASESVVCGLAVKFSENY